MYSNSFGWHLFLIYYHLKLHKDANISGGSRISPSWGRQLSRGSQDMILPNFPNNCMKLKEFGPSGGWSVPRATPLNIGNFGSFEKTTLCGFRATCQVLKFCLLAKKRFWLVLPPARGPSVFVLSRITPLATVNILRYHLHKVSKKSPWTTMIIFLK